MYSFVFFLVLVSVEKIYQTRKTVFDHISNHLKVRQKYPAVRRIFNSLLGDWKYGFLRREFYSFLPLRKTKSWSQVTHWSTIEAENLSKILCSAKTAI